MNIMVSKCLLGINCKYNGENNLNSRVLEISKRHNCILICPEEFGGLKTPRDPSEIKNGIVISRSGVDVSEYFKKGKEICVNLAKINNIDLAILKESSPSCGVNDIYDGTFTNKKIKGMGITSRALKDLGIKIYSEKDDLDDLNL